MRRFTKQAAARSRPLILESLERRYVLDGNVDVYTSGGDLHIDGDSNHNRVRVQQVGFNTFSVSSFDGATRINGGAGPATFSGITHDLRVRLFDGNDVLELLGVAGDPLTIRDELVVLTHSGHDQVRMTQTVVFDDLFLDTGSDDDTIDIGQGGGAGGVWIGDRSTIVTGHGQDNIGIAWSTFRDRLVLDAGGNEDRARLVHSDFRAESDIIGGAAFDRLTKFGNEGWWRLNIISFEQVDANNPPDQEPPPTQSPPTAANDTATVNDGGSVTINVAANDSDPEGQLDLSSIVITQQPASGNVTVNANGTVTYTHDGSPGTSDTFRYTIRDEQGQASNEAVVTISITQTTPPPDNDPPIASPDAATVAQGATRPIDVAANDVDPDGQLDLGSIVITVAPLFGTATANSDGTITYAHNGSDSTFDSLRYSIRDQQGSVSNETLVTITIGAGQPPVATDDLASVAAGSTVTLNLVSNDTVTSANLDLDSIVITEAPASGVATVNANGTVTYHHNGSASTSDTFRYTIRDTGGQVSNEAVVSLTVVASDTRPVALSDMAEVTEDAGIAATGNVLANDDSGSDTDPLAVSAVGGSAANVAVSVPGRYGTFLVEADGDFEYILDEFHPDVDALDDLEELIERIAYTIQDGDGQSSATLSVRIRGTTDTA